MCSCDVQVDFREVMVKKRGIIECEQQLLDMIGISSELVQCSDEVQSCIGV